MNHFGIPTLKINFLFFFKIACLKPKLKRALELQAKSGPRLSTGKERL